MFLILFYTHIYIFDTRSGFSVNRTIIFSVPQAFPRASSGVKENGHLNYKLELCWKILVFIISFNIINFEVSWYSLEQYIGCINRQAFNYYCSLLQV